MPKFFVLYTPYLLQFLSNKEYYSQSLNWSRLKTKIFIFGEDKVLKKVDKLEVTEKNNLTIEVTLLFVCSFVEHIIHKNKYNLVKMQKRTHKGSL